MLAPVSQTKIGWRYTINRINKFLYLSRTVAKPFLFWFNIYKKRKQTQVFPMFLKKLENLSLPKAVIFDWDNTLVDTSQVIRQSLHNLFGFYGFSSEQVNAFTNKMGASLRETFPKIFGEAWQEARDKYYELYEIIHLNMLKSFEGAQESLQFLKEKDIHCCIISNKCGSYLRLEVSHLGWHDYFISIIGANDLARDKPDPASVYAALAPIPLRPSKEVWFVGDMPADYLCAVNAGCQPIILGTPSVLEEKKEAIFVENCEGFYKILKNKFEPVIY